MRRLSSLDAQFLAAEGGNFGAQYCGVGIYETTELTAATMRQLVAERIDACPPLRWRVVEVPLALDHPVFVDAEVNLHDHVFESTLPGPADEQTLAAEVAMILATPLERDKPLWKINVFHGLRGRTAVVITLHHAAADGVSAGNLLSVLLDDDHRAAARADRKPGSVPGKVGLAARGLASLPLRRACAIRSVPGVLGHLDQVPALRSLPGAHTVARIARWDLGAARLDAPRMRFNAKLSPRRSVAFGTVSLHDVKTVKNALGSTVNDVVVALCAGALRRRLTATGDLPADPLVAYLPVSTRAPEAIAGYGNAISSIIAAIPTHLPEATERLAFTNETLTAGKQRADSAPGTLLSDVNDPIPVPLFGLAARGLRNLISSRFVRPPVNLIISNVPGSPIGLSCSGAALVANYPLSLVFDGFALNITVVSYQDRLDIGIVGDAEAVPDTWDLIADIRTELTELVELTAPGRSAD